MDVLVSTLGLSPAVVTEVIDKLSERRTRIGNVLLVTTKGATLSHHVLNVDFKYGYYAGGGINVEYEELPTDDIYGPEDCVTFRRILQRVLRTAVKRAGDISKVHVSLAGGRKTMQVDTLLTCLANGIDDIYHIIASEVPGTSDIRKSFSEDEQKILIESSKGEVKPPDNLLQKVREHLHPHLTLHLIRIPVPKLLEEQRKQLREQLFQ